MMSDNSSNNIDAIYGKLESCLEQNKLEDGMLLLNQVKRMLLLVGTGTGIAAGTVGDNATANDHALIMNKILAAMELGVLITIQAEDLEAFGRTVAQIQPYYATHTSSSTTIAVATTTPRKLLIIGLNLMHLLVDNRLSEFHSQLELLNEIEASNPYISFPVSMERQLMVGIYDEIFQMQLPSPLYQLFVNHLLQTVRNSIADCMEVSYTTLTIQQATDIMKFNSTKELIQFIQEERDDWIVDDKNNNSTITFQPIATSGIHDIPSMEWIQQSLTYATELERII